MLSGKWNEVPKIRYLNKISNIAYEISAFAHLFYLSKYI